MTEVSTLNVTVASTHLAPQNDSLIIRQQELPTAGGEVSGIQIVIIVITVVLMLGLITCIISHYKMGAWSWREGWGRSPSLSEPQSLLQVTPPQDVSPSQHNYTPAPHSSVLYTTDNVEERQRLELVSLQDQHIRQQSVQMDFNLGLPHTITLPDGEEFPYNSSKSLHLQDPNQDNEIIRSWIKPPPNRIVSEGESPPPYRSNSVSLLSKPSTPPVLRTSDINPLVIRSNSVSVNINVPNNHFSYQQESCNSSSTPHCRTTNTRDATSSSLNNRCNSGGRMQSFFNFVDPPPRYCDLTTNQDHSNGSPSGV